MEDNPGRQSVGSFNPINDTEWSLQSVCSSYVVTDTLLNHIYLQYIGDTVKFFTAISAHDRDSVAEMIRDGADVNRRDHVGRTPLHIAILVDAVDIAQDLIDSGARMTARLVDGRTSLHLAAQFGRSDIVRRLLYRSNMNADQAEKEKKKEKEASEMDVDHESDSKSERLSSEDDWSSDDSDGESPAKEPTANAAKPLDGSSSDIPEDPEDEPDVFDVNLTDWDLGLTPLGFGVTSGSLDVVGDLITHGSDPSIYTKAQGSGMQPLHPLALTAVIDDHDTASRIAARLLLGGAISATADKDMLSIFHRIVRCPGQQHLVSSLLQQDKKAKAVINHPFLFGGVAVYPLVSAISNGDWSTCAGMSLI
jgi:hypothetical protein